MHFRFAQTAIDTGPARLELLDSGAGGYVSFEGWVRNHNEGHEVTRLEYEAFQELAVKEGERIVAEALRRFPVKRVVAEISMMASIKSKYLDHIIGTGETKAKTMQEGIRSRQE